MPEESKKDRIERVIKCVEHPEIAHTLFDLSMIKIIDIKENKVTLTLKVPMAGIPIKDYLIKSIKSAVESEDKSVKVEIGIEEMNDAEHAKFMSAA